MECQLRPGTQVITAWGLPCCSKKREIFASAQRAYHFPPPHPPLKTSRPRARVSRQSCGTSVPDSETDKLHRGETSEESEGPGPAADSARQGHAPIA